MTIRKIEVEVKGTEENTGLALASLLEKVDDTVIRKAVSVLSTTRLMRLAKSVHGQMYREMFS